MFVEGIDETDFSILQLPSDLTLVKINAKGIELDLFN
jgi:hypothetical protein